MSAAIPWGHLDGRPGPTSGDQERDSTNSNSMLRLERRQPSPARFFIDGPGRLSNALQLMTSALNSVSSSDDTPLPLTRDPSPTPSHYHNQSIRDEDEDEDEGEEEDISSPSPYSYPYQEVVPDNTQNHQDDPPPSEQTHLVHNNIKSVAGKTIVASDNEVSNGFVKDGKMLPYVFEANESGTRKRSSKILPVCGVCGKRFVCVTTMKRHLVTHTGEKPFACKICGKQYTQKGNLRVHERTHRNDRPFECNICHQKFYRKEPMQKHQWRQHGVVHFKNRPLGATPCETPPIAPPTPSISPKPTLAMPEGILYNSIVDRIKINSMDSYNQDSRSLNGPPPPPSSGSFLNFTHTRPESRALTNPPMSPESFQPEDLSASRAIDNRRAPSPPRRTHLNLPMIPGNRFSALVPKLMSAIDIQNEEFKNAKFDTNTRVPSTPTAAHHITLSDALLEHQSDRDVFSKSHISPSQIDHNHSSTADHRNMNLGTTVAQADLSPNSKLLNIHDPDERYQEKNGSQVPQQQAPMKLKKILAHAYQKEVEEQRNADDELNQRAAESHSVRPEARYTKNGALNSNEEPATHRGEKEMVECQCKSCGNVFTVHDPYNFRCSNCNAKYTSLPTHMIADPLQCIGCCQVFPHKPALKAHQMCEEKERPFRCCKCGYGFRQKAHLQKHQWRIHRRKLEPDQSMREAEAIFLAMKNVVTIPKTNTTPPPAQLPSSQNLTLQPSVTITATTTPLMVTVASQEHANQNDVSSLPASPENSNACASPMVEQGSQPLDLSPTKPSALSITVSTGQPSSSLDHSGHSELGQPSSSSQPVYLLRVAEGNPLLNQQISLPDNSSATYPSQSSSNGRSISAWKKQRTCSDPPPTNHSENTQIDNIMHHSHATDLSAKEPISTHRTLPPIATLQQPLSSNLRAHTSAISPNSFKHSSWLSAGRQETSLTTNTSRNYSRPYSMPNMSTNDSPRPIDSDKLTTESSHMVRHDLLRDPHNIRTV
ncbi:hypothetical protein TCAL_05497 [Tigriopus californicus]|uniref:C2H2-type domain-containing protein n=1 Tax=Tigriopus californicus TaxID=6832 RepID=A0A553NPL0_TIGCA|nr:uncharacterized protein LOC131879370 [Tigriopus californicus]XP_059081656.1 uncharacterized protein LOC131879370 [Tigriopus californicus]TRY67378.1 hypothetical protein TCAL_05497 [Tigriopus californicus]|eukprot:TCALIF_05497-PA protein Name:"Similar to Zbtb24 Zinc finger and BTB domain-containing protein 24 (Rattus norvegicus)" AED:0.13 eAED:0.13 QI:570/1/0.66/1/1/1/3/0/994